MEVGVGEQGAELEDIACPLMCAGEAALVKVTKPPQLHNSTLESAVGVAHVEGEAQALAQDVLGGQDFFAGGAGELVGKLLQAVVQALGLAGEEDASHSQARVVGHEAVGEVEAAEEDGGGGLDLGGQVAELGSAQQIDDVEVE